MMPYVPIVISALAVVIALIAESRTRQYQKGELQLRVVKRELEVWKRVRATITLAEQLEEHHFQHKHDYSGGWSEYQRETSKRCLHRLKCLQVELEGGDTKIGIVGRLEKTEVDHNALCQFESIDARLEDIESELGEIQGDLIGLRDSKS
jgi:hypothetical protein